MTNLEKQKVILEKIVEDLADLSNDHLRLMTDVCETSESIKRWKINRDKLTKLNNDFDDFLLVRSGKEPIFESIEES